MEKKVKSSKSQSSKPAASKSKVDEKSVVKTAAVAPVVDGIGNRRELVGLVVSDKMTKTIVVKVDRQVRHRLYKKYVTKSERYKAHDEKNSAKNGDLVSLIESRPLSKEKRWALKKIIRTALVGSDAELGV